MLSTEHDSEGNEGGGGDGSSMRDLSRLHNARGGERGGVC